MGVITCISFMEISATHFAAMNWFYFVDFVYIDRRCDMPIYWFGAYILVYE